MCRAMSMRIERWCGTGQRTGWIRPAFVNPGCSIGSADAGQWSVSLDWVGARCWIDLWKKGLPPLLCWSRNKLNTPDAPQQPERYHPLQSASPGFRHVQKRRPSFPIHPPNQDGNNVTGEHTVRNEGSGDHEKHPRESHGGETDSTQESFGHFCVHGS